MLRRLIVVLALVLVAAVVAGVVVVASGGVRWPAAVVGGGAPQQAAGAIPAGAVEVVVDHVHDGDTLTLTDDRRVRLIGIDAPEVGDNAECFGDAATAALERLAPEGAHLWALADEDPFDRYGRSLFVLFTSDGVNINLELVSEGAATVVYFAPNALFQDDLHAAERSARDAGAGLWGSCG